MISVSSSEIGLGFGGIEEEEDMEMEMEMEMEEDSDFEESTHSYVSCVDPDVALSYIVNTHTHLLFLFIQLFEIIYSQLLLTKKTPFLECLQKDEKLENVLGHFQKDFEGGVSAENLGKRSFSHCYLLYLSG